MFVAEKSGVIKVFDSLTDTTPTVFADLNERLQLLGSRPAGLALHPDFPTTPYVYVLYTYDHELGSAQPAPRWGTPGSSPMRARRRRARPAMAASSADGSRASRRPETS